MNRAMFHARRCISAYSLHNSQVIGRRSSLFHINSSRVAAPAWFLVRHLGSDSRAADGPSSPTPKTVDITNWSADSGREWWQGFKSLSVDAFDSTKQIVKPYLQQLMDPSSFLYATQGVLPTTVAVASCAGAWMVLPRVLRRLHTYVEQVPIRGNSGGKALEYQLSVWAALEDPTRLFITLVTFSQIAALIAPETMAANLEQVWRGGLVVSFLWFLHRWKTFVFSRMLIGKSTTKEEQERYMALDKVCSVGIIVVGATALAEASGVAVQSILTVGGIGGVATAFAARDILGNVLSGLTLQFFKPFSVGDYITAGNIEGQVTEMGMHSTSLLNNDKYPVIVPNSFFSSQVIVNKSHVPRQSLKSRMYIRFSDIDKLPNITHQVMELLKAHPKIFTEKEAPHCFLSKTAPSHLEITIAYDVHPLSKRDALALEQEILVKASEVVTSSGAMLGAP